MSLFVPNAYADTTPPAPGGGSAPTTATTAPASHAAPVAAPSQPSTMSMLAPFALMFVVIYFLIIRPQQRKMKQHQKVVSEIKYGDEVITNSGIIGKVTGMTERVLTVEIADGVRVKILRGQIASVNPDLSSPKSKEAAAR